MSDVSEHSEFCYPKKKEKRGGHMIKCLLTELGRAGRENIWPSVMAHGPRCARSVRHDLGSNIFPSGPPTQSVSTYYFLMVEAKWGPHSLDRFENHENAQFPRFYSRIWCPGTEGVDSFSVPWAGENN